MSGPQSRTAGTPVERTGLAWRRTALAAAAFAAVALKADINHQGALDSVTASLAMLAAVTLYLCGRLRDARPRERVSGGVMVMAMMSCVAATTAAAVTVAVGR